MENKTVKETSQMDLKINEIVTGIKKDIATKGYFTASTCDARNWDVQEHFAMLNIQRNNNYGFTISSEVNHRVTDWKAF